MYTNDSGRDNYVKKTEEMGDPAKKDLLKLIDGFHDIAMQRRPPRFLTFTKLAPASFRISYDQARDHLQKIRLQSSQITALIKLRMKGREDETLLTLSAADILCLVESLKLAEEYSTILESYREKYRDIVKAKAHN